jgi:hypothetical protein
LNLAGSGEAIARETIPASVYYRIGSIRSGHKSSLQAFCLREGGLTLVGGQENLAFKQQGASNVKEIYRPSTDLFRMSRGQSPSR